MSAGKFRIQYDDEYDILFIYNKVKRSSQGIEWGDIDLSYDKMGKLVNLELNNASKLLSNLTKRNVSKALLKKISDCKLETKERGGILYINFKLLFEGKGIKPIEDTLPVKSINHRSPVSS